MDVVSSVKDVILTFFPFLEQVPAVRAVLGFALVFFLPGLSWSLVLLKKVTLLERIAVSFGVSIAIVTLSVFAANLLLGVRVNGLNSLLIIIVVTILPLIWYYLNRLIMGKNKDSDIEISG